MKLELKITIIKIGGTLPEKQRSASRLRQSVWVEVVDGRVARLTLMQENRDFLLLKTCNYCL